MTERELIEEAVVEFYDYADALLAARRDDPGEDLVSTLLAAEADGDRLSEVECVNLVLNVLIGGVDTTQSQLAHADPPAGRASRAVGGAARRPVAGRRGGRGGAALRADHAVHGAHRRRGHGGARRRLPGRHRRPRGRLHGQPRRARGARPLRHRAHRRRAPDDVRRRASTTAWARTSRAPSCRRAWASWPPHIERLELDGEPGLRRGDRHLRARPPADPLQRGLRPSGAASIMPAPGMSAAEVNLRAILRIVLVIVGVVLTLYVIYLLRKPIGWIVLATFIAVAMSAPVNLLARHMHRGLAIALAYLGPAGDPGPAGADPRPADRQRRRRPRRARRPSTPRHAQDYVQKNKTLRKLEDDYGVIIAARGAGQEAAAEDRHRRRHAERHRRRRRQLGLRRR